MKTSSIRKLTLSLAAASSIVSQDILRADWGDDNPTGVSGEFNGNVSTGCSYDPLTGNEKRQIIDILVPGAVGAYPLAFTRTMNSRVDSSTGVVYPFGKAGAWRHSYQWEVKFQTFVSYDPCATPPAASNYVVTYPDGRKVTFVPDGGNPYRSATPGIGDRFSPIAGPEEDGTYTGYLLLRDGGRVRFKATIWPPPPAHGCEGPIVPPNPPITFGITFSCAGFIDPYGQEITITRSGGSIDTIKEPAGRNLKLYYTTFNSTSVIDRVEERASSDPNAPVGRTVKYNYAVYGGTTALDNVVYFNDSALTAHYTYQASNAGGANPPLIPHLR